MNAIHEYLKEMELTMDEVQQLSLNRAEWRQSVAKCVFDIVELSSKV